MASFSLLSYIFFIFIIHINGVIHVLQHTNVTVELVEYLMCECVSACYLLWILHSTTSLTLLLLKCLILDILINLDGLINLIHWPVAKSFLWYVCIVQKLVLCIHRFVATECELLVVMFSYWDSLSSCYMKASCVELHAVSVRVQHFIVLSLSYCYPQCTWEPR